MVEYQTIQELSQRSPKGNKLKNTETRIKLLASIQSSLKTGPF